MSKKAKYIPYILIIFICCFLWIVKHSDNDLYFDLKTGEDILKYGIDFKDHFSFIPNLVYIYHHFLYDIIISFIFKMGGYISLFVFFLAFYVLLGVILFYINNKFSNNKFLSLIVTLVSLYLMKTFITTRVQTITYPLFLLYIYFVWKLYCTGHKKYSIFLIIISVLIVNLHMPMWILTIVFYLPFLVELLFWLFKKKKPNLFNIINTRIEILKPKSIKIFLITFIVLCFSGLISPLKLYPYTFFINALNNDSYSFINEMKSTVLISQFHLLLLYIITILTLLFLNVKIKLRSIILILGLILFSLIARRNIAYVYLLLPTLLHFIIHNNYNLKNLLKIKLLNKLNKKLLYTVVIILLSISSTCCIFVVTFYKNNFNYNEDYYPKETVKYIKENLDYQNIHLFNEFGFGSYLEFHDIPVFIDSRAEVYISEFNGGYDIISDYKKTSNFNEYEKVFEKYNINYIIISKNESLDQYLKNSNKYELIFKENNMYHLYKKL